MCLFAAWVEWREEQVRTRWAVREFRPPPFCLTTKLTRAKCISLPLGGSIRPLRAPSPSGSTTLRQRDRKHERDIGIVQAVGSYVGPAGLSSAFPPLIDSQRQITCLQGGPAIEALSSFGLLYSKDGSFFYLTRPPGCAMNLTDATFLLASCNRHFGPPLLQ